MVAVLRYTNLSRFGVLQVDEAIGIRAARRIIDVQTSAVIQTSIY